MPSELKDHPLLLVPKEYRQKLLEDALKSDPRLPPQFVSLIFIVGIYQRETA